MNDHLHSRIRGALFGCAVGDALGSTYEGARRDEMRTVEMRGGGQFNLKKGDVTDDTLMMLALAETYCETGKFDRDVFLDKVILTLRKDDTTFGRTTRTLAALLEQGCTPNDAAYAFHVICGSRTNGSIMRTIPIGLVMRDDIEKTAHKVSSFTHYDVEAGDCCAIISKAAAGLMAGLSKSEILEEIPEKYFTEELCPSIDPLDTIRCALSCFRDGNGYDDVIRRACVLGGDTDTNACIAGGLAGILWGVPEKWIDALLLKDRITEVAERLSDRIQKAV